MGTEDLKSDLLKVCRWVGIREWCPGTSGNVSVLNPDRGEVYIKGSGASMMDVKPEDILTLDLEGNILQGEGRPSKEVNFHLGIYKARGDVKAVLHTHSPFATAYAAAGKEIPQVTATAQLILKRIPLMEYALPGSLELAGYVIEGFRDPTVQALLLKNHGVVTIGDTVYRTYHINEWVEEAAKAAFLSSIIKRLS